MSEAVTATAMREQHERDRDERILRDRMEWFFRKYAPADKYEAGEFHADLMMVVQAIHRDASRETHRLLMAAVAAMPNPLVLAKKE